jgi:hypothetical protein
MRVDDDRVGARPIVPVSIDCGLQVPGPNDVDGVFAEIPGFTVTEICPSEIDPSFAIQEFGVVTHLNVPLTAEGFAYTDGPTVVIAYVMFGSPRSTVEDALTHILDNVY